MGAAKRSYEFRFFRIEDGFPFRDLPAMPTVCLLVADHIEPPYEYEGLVTDLMAIGCGFFMTWGGAASKFEDVLDETVIELSNKRNDDTFALTTAHQEESAEEVAFFMLESTLLDEKAIRCCIGFASHVPPAREAELRREIEKIVEN